MVTRNKYILPGCILAGLFIVPVLLQGIFAYKAVRAASEGFREHSSPQGIDGWNSGEVRQLKKDICWYEQLLMLSKTDSNYLTIDLRDSTVHLKLKGVSLAEAEIIHSYPADFFAVASEEVYLSAGKVTPILSETANFTKQPVRKVMAFSNNEEKEEPVMEIADARPLHWTLSGANSLRIVITGVQTAADSAIVLHAKRDVMLHRAKDLIREPFPQTYSPTLYLWLGDKEAKAIYRAVPPGGKMLFRN